MKRLFFVFLFILTLAFPSWAHSPLVGVAEEDTSPSVYVYQILFPNASLTDNANGTVSVSFPGGSGSAIVLDLSDDAADESADLSEIATAGVAAATIFTEPSANKLLIDTDIPWPVAATGDSATAFFSAGTVEFARLPAIDDDSFATATATNLASAESIKAYVDANSGVLSADVIKNSHIDWADIDNLGEEGLLTVSDTTDTTSFVGLFESATGDLASKTDLGLTYNAGTGVLTATGFAGPLTGAVTGNADTATTAATVTTAAQPNITSLGTLTTLAVDNITINGNDISSTAGTDLTITPLAGQQIVLDGTIIIDAGAVTGATSITSTAFVGDVTGALTGNADTATLAATVTITDNENTNENNAVVFLPGGDLDGGNLALESDGTFYYNPSTGTVAATIFSGAVAGASSVTFLDANITPDADGELVYDNTVAGVDDGSFAYFAGTDTVYYIPGYAVLPTDSEDDYHLAYDKDTDRLYWKADTTAGAPVLSAITAPEAAWAITLQDTETVIWTTQTTATDQFNFDATGNFGDISIFVIEQLTGNPTNGTLLELRTADAEDDVDQLLLTNGVDDYVTHHIAESGTYTINVTSDGTALVAITDNVSITGNATVSGSFIIGSASMNEADLEKLDGITNGTQAASKAVVADANVNTGISKVTQLHIGASGSEVQVTSTAAELNILDGVTSSAAELNYLDITTLGTGENSKAVTLTAAGNFTAPAGTWDMSSVTGITLQANEIVDADVVNALTITAQAGSTWNVADSITALSVYTGTTSLEETTAANDSGAYIIGVYDEFTNSNSTNVQGVLNDLDSSISAGATAYDDIGAPDANGSIPFGTWTGTYTSASSAWNGMFITDTVATVAAATELLTLSFTDSEGAATGQLNFLQMIANSVTVVDFDEDGLKIGTGTPTNTMDGGDLYITDDVEIDGTLTLGALSMAGSAAPTWTWGDSDAAGGDAADEEAMQIMANLTTTTEDDEIADWRISYMHDDGVVNANAAAQTAVLWDGSAYSLMIGVLSDDYAGGDVGGYESLKFDFDTGTNAEIAITSPSSANQLDIQIATLVVDALTTSGAVTLGSTFTDGTLTGDGSGGITGIVNLNSVIATELAELETIGATTISAAQWAGLGGATTAGIALWDDADNVAQLVTLGLTATASEINTPLDGASVTLTEFQELEAIGATTISANQWAALGGIAETLAAAELDILDGVTATAAELNYLDIASLGTGAASKAVVLDGSGNYAAPAGAWNLGGVTTFEIWNSTSDMTLGVAGQIGLQLTDDQLVFHGGAAGEIQGEAALSLLEHFVLTFDPAYMYDQESTYRTVPIGYLGDDFIEGFTMTEWKVAYVGGDPTTELDADIVCDTTPDFNPAAGATVMDVIDTTAGASTADTGFDSATCANGSQMYIRFGADPADANVVVTIDIWGYAEED